MGTSTNSLTEDCLSRLQKEAIKLGLSPEELVRVSIHELLTRPDEALREVVDEVHRKNAELHRRLARCAISARRNA
jgi:antitoxin FitA